MLKYRWPHTIGIQILITTRVTYALVLLTANLEDVRKIARQFVDDTVADQIAHFIAQASVTHATNISEENLQNENLNEESDVDWNMYQHQHHPSPISNDEKETEGNAISGAVNVLRVSKDPEDTTQVITKSKPKVFPFKQIDKDVKRDLYLNTVNTVKKTTSFYTYDLILTQDQKQTPKFEWKKEVDFDLMSKQNFNNPDSYTHDTIENPVKKGKVDKQYNEIDNNYSKEQHDKTLKSYVYNERLTERFETVKKKKTTGNANRLIKTKASQRDTGERFESRFNEIGTTLKYKKTFVKPKSDLEPYKNLPAMTTANEKLLRIKESEYKSQGKKRSTKYLGGVVKQYAKDKFDYEDSIYIKEQILATSGPVQLYKTTTTPTTFIPKDPLGELIKEYERKSKFAAEHKNLDDSLYFKSHLESLYKDKNYTDANSIPDSAANLQYKNSTTYRNRLNRETDGATRRLIGDNYDSVKLGGERDDVMKILSKKNKYGKKKIHKTNDKVSSSKESNYRKMKVDDTTTKNYWLNPQYKSSASYGDYF